MVQKGIEWYWNYGKYSTLPTFINQGIYDNRHIFVEIPLGMYSKSRFIGLEIPMSPTEISVPMSPPLGAAYGPGTTWYWYPIT